LDNRHGLINRSTHTVVAGNHFSGSGLYMICSLLGMGDSCKVG